MPQAFTPQPYQQLRELSEEEFTAIRDRLIDQAPGGLSEVEFNRWLNPRMEQALGEAENTAPRPQGSAIGRVIGGAAEMLNPIEIAKGAYQTVRHPIDTLGGIIGSHVGQFGKAGEQFARGNYSEAAGHVGAGLIPIVGPVAAGIGEEIGATGDVARGLGKATGLLAPAGIRPAMRVARRVVPADAARRLRRGAQERVADVMAPKVGANKERFGRKADKVAPQVTEMLATEGAPWTREGLAQQIGAKFEDASAELDAATDARLAARTFNTEDVVNALKEKRREFVAEPVEASKLKPRIIPPSKEAVAAFDTEGAALAQGQRTFMLQWLKSGLDEMRYQPGGTTPRQRREAFETWRPGDPEHAKFAIGPASGRVAGTPTQEMLHAIGVKGSRGEIAAQLDRILAGKTKHPKLDRLADALIEAFDGETFDFSRLPDETIAKLGISRKQLKSPMTMPDIDDSNRAIAARFFPEQVPFDVMPALDPVAPQATKVGVPLGKDVVTKAERVGVIDGAIAKLQRLGPRARYEAIRKIRQDYDEMAKPVYSPAMTTDYMKVQRGASGAADVTGTLREYMATWEPETAAANATFHVWKSAQDVMTAAKSVERVRPRVGRLIMARLAMVLIGAKAGTAAAIGGMVLAPGIEAALAAPTTRLQTARLMTKLAKAVEKIDVGSVNSLTAKLMKLAPSGAAAVNQATSPGGFQTQPGLAQ